MKTLQKVWDDIRKGENIDLYLTTLLALSLAVLNVLGIAPNTLLAPLTLSVLALLAIASLVNRHQNNKLLEKIENAANNSNVFGNQSKANEFLISYLNKHHVQTAHFIEYDGDTIKPVILELLENGTKIHLLLQHPDGAISTYQQTKILHQIESKEHDFAGFSHLLTISYYKDIASVRGRLFGNELVCMGWYTYDRRVTKKGEPEVWGHTNPAMVIESTDKSFSIMQGMFDTVFNNLLNNSEAFETVKQRYLESNENLSDKKKL